MTCFSSAQQASACRPKQTIPLLEIGTETGIFGAPPLSFLMVGESCLYQLKNWCAKCDENDNTRGMRSFTSRTCCSKVWHIGARFDTLVHGGYKNLLSIPRSYFTDQCAITSKLLWTGTLTDPAASPSLQQPPRMNLCISFQALHLLMSQVQVKEETTLIEVRVQATALT